MMMDRLMEAIKIKKNPTVVGLDPVLEKLPLCYRQEEDGREDILVAWGRDVVDAVRDIVPAIKPNIAFFEVFGAAGFAAFERLVRYAHEKGLLVIDDSKRGDVGHTAMAYARAHLEKGGAIDADFMTVAPFLGKDALQPFIDVARREEKGLFLLLRTSNPGASELLDTKDAEGQSLQGRLVDMVLVLGQGNFGRHGYTDIGAVVGATCSKEAESLRERMPHTFFLVPGYGTQGAGAADAIPCFDARGLGALVNASRSVLYAGDVTLSREAYKSCVRQAAQAMQKDLYEALKNHCKDLSY